MPDDATADSTAATFLACLREAAAFADPFDHWLLREAVSRQTAAAICALPFAPPDDPRHVGRREDDNERRVFFSPANQARFAVCAGLAAAFDSAPVRDRLSAMTGARLDGARLRIEYCMDRPGFWLEPHTDIAVKRFTMVIYLADDPALADAGTDILEGPPDHVHVRTAPYGRGRGVIFVPAANTWHGVGHTPIRGERRSLIVNYVSPDWRATHELC
ncbi:MAG: 2OG-Fe(II) oxygenase [Alphaproteobacteria bacterium]